MNPFEEDKIPALDKRTYPTVQTATLAMGCFWGPESLFGATPGVIRTRVGFAGGSTHNPTYRTIADHIETIQLDFDPEQVTYSQLLNQFFSHHTPTKEPRKRQYASAIFFHSPEQEKAAQEAIQEAGERFRERVQTELLPYSSFYLAEDRHQKWKLRRVTAVLQELQKIYSKEEAFNNSTAVARVNGYLGGNGNQEQFMEEMGSLGLSYPIQQTLLAHFLAKDMGDFPFKR